jgi:hypothetical protein
MAGVGTASWTYNGRFCQHSARKAASN